MNLAFERRRELSCRFIVELSRFFILPFMADLFFALSSRGDARD